MGSGKLCETCPPRYPSLSVAQWRAILRIPAPCVIDDVTTNEIERAILRADEQIALYAGWWPLPTAICEEHEISRYKGRCRFAVAGNRGWITLRYGKVQRIDGVEFLRQAGVNGCSSDECYTVDAGTVCLVDGDYGSVEINDRAVATWGCPPDISRIRIRYTAGECSLVEGLVWLLARLAATYLCSPFLCGVDLRNDRWDFYDLATTETTHETVDKVDLGSDHGFDGGIQTTTDKTVSTVAQHRAPFPKDWYLCPFGPTRAGYEMWQYLKLKRRVRAWRL